MTAPTTAAPEEIRAALRPLVEGDVRVDAFTRHLYSSDASMYAIEPLAVAFPKHAGDVAAIVTEARRLGVPVLPRGAGTSLAGQTVGRAVVLDFSRYMNRILEIDPERRTARVQPGVVQDQLNRAAAEYGLMFGPDTSTSNRATIGGMIGNNSAGSHSITYGSTIDHVHAVSVVLSDGSPTRFAPGTAARGELHANILAALPGVLDAAGDAIHAFPPFWRHSGGYRLNRVRTEDGLDLAKLVVGSEGTLAVVTEAEVGLVKKPRSRALAVGHFRSTLDAIAATRDALDMEAGSVELMDRAILDLSRQRVDFAELGTLLVDDPDALLFVEFFAADPDEAAAQAEELASRWKAGGHGYHTLLAASEREQAAVLKVRKAGLGLLMASSTGTRRPLAFVEDTAVPPEVLVPYVRDFKEILDSYDMTAGFYGHCSVGCLHIRPFVDLRESDGVERMRSVASEIAALAARYGGVNSSEHGDGLARSEFNRELFGDRVYDAMREVKRLFDPENRLNPGKIVDSPPMTENLRDPALPPAAGLRTTLDFSAYGGMRGAADRCMNIGACRKDDAGVMCPSYMATREEEHSTRGRANALVKALSSPDPKAGLDDERLHGILDLCLECKACASECPLGVDMATMKSEFLDKYQAVHGVPLRSRVFSRIRGLNRLGSALAPLANGSLRLPGVRAVMERGLGIARRRPLPHFERASLVRWFGRHTAPPGPWPRGEVVLLADSFTTYTEPAAGRAAVELLERAGYRVRLESSGCCGRASLSKGVLDKARGMAAAMVARLAPYAERGVPIVGVEPSCLLTLADEYRTLLPDDERVPVVAAAARLVPELLVEAIDDGALVLDPDAEVAGRRVVLHGHCHEKAVVGTAATRALLERLPGARVEEIDAGCCGMAGSFGFESEHYDLSMRIGGLRLFPKLAAEDDDVLVAATGVSCRQQIAHGAGRRARHPVELVHAALPPP